MDHEATVRYLAGKLRIPAADLDRTLSVLTEYLSARMPLDRVPSDRLCSHDGKLRNIETPLRRDR